MSLLPGLDGKHDSLFVIMIMFVFRSLFPHVPQPSGQRVAMNNAPSPSMTVYMRCLDVVSMDCPISYLLTAFYVIVNIIQILNKIFLYCTCRVTTCVTLKPSPVIQNCIFRV